MSRVLSPAERAVWDFLQEWGRGRLHAMTQAWIAGQCALTVRELQEALHALVTEHGLPICTTSGKPPGVFIAQDLEDFRIGESNLRGRIIAIARRYRALHGGEAARRLLGQLSLEMGEGDV